MKRLDIIDAIAKEHNLAKTVVTAVVDALWGTIVKALKKGDDVQFTGLGKFEVVKRKARNGINPATKEPMKLPAKKVVRFRTGARLNDAVS